MRNCLVLLFLLCAIPAWGAEKVSPDIFSTPCARYRVPLSLVLAIAHVESRLHPWAVNVAGRSYSPSSREEALLIIGKARERGLSHDIGLMQINNWWLKRLGISPETAIEPGNNALIGVWILAREIQRHGLTWRAVARYHTPATDSLRGKTYAVNVIKTMRKIR